MPRSYLSTVHGFLIGKIFIFNEFGLTGAFLPGFTTVNTRKQALTMKVWRVLHRLSVSRHELRDVRAIDATGFGRRAVSRHYGNVSNTTSRP